MKKDTLTVFMMGKNEEKCLRRALDSIKDIADEIIFVDTGSTDKTMEIALEYKVKLIEEPWADDFSKHRNTGLAACTGEWLMQLDCDEELHPDSVKTIRETLFALVNEDVVWISLWNLYEEGKPTFLPALRIFRNGAIEGYTGIVHNRPVVKEEKYHHRSNIKFNHYGYDLSPEEMEKKHERTRILLEKRLKDDPRDSYALMQYAQLFRVRDKRFNVTKSPGILACCERAAELTDMQYQTGYHVHLQSLEMGAWACLYMQQLDKALLYGKRAVALKEDYIDAIMVVALCYQNMAKYEESTAWFKKYIVADEQYRPDEDTSMIKMLYLDRKADAFYGLGHNLEMEKDVDGAVNYFLLALKNDPSLKTCYERLYRLHLRGELDIKEWEMTQKIFEGYEGVEVLPDHYDKQYADGYNSDLKMEPIRNKATDWLMTASPRSILEIGCGTGKIGRTLEKLGIDYHGIDFSEQAIKKAKELGTKSVEVRSAYDETLYQYDCVMAFEVLEHLEDMRIMELIKPGTRVIFSVPSFMDPSHIREYPTAEFIKFRYRGILDISTIKEFTSSIGRIYLCDGMRINGKKETNHGTDIIQNQDREQDLQSA